MKKTLGFLLILVLLTGLLSVGAAAEGPRVVLSNQNLRADGVTVACEKYNIDGYNYFKLRDIAFLVNHTGSQFSVGWDGEKRVVSIVTGEEYVPDGSELDLSGGDKSATAMPSTQTILIDGQERSDLSVYNIGGNNYFKLRDLGNALGFEVDYDSAANSAVIVSRQPSSEPGDEEWNFTVQVERFAQEFKAEDDTVIAMEAIERPVLRLVNAAGEVFSGSEPGRGVTAQQLAVCQAFNDAASAVGVWDIDIEEEGRSIYELRKETGDEMPPVGREITVSEIDRIGGLLSVLEGDYAYLGGAHPDYGLCAWNFDLSSGTFVDLMDLTDRPEELREMIAYEVAAQINASEYREGFYDNWFDLLLEKETFEVFFDSESLTVFFQEYEIGPHAIGVPVFEIPYSSISRFLNGYGERLLALPAETTVIGDFHEAQDLWSWLEAGAPMDYNDSRTEGEIWYYRVDDPEIRTLADVKAMLSRYVDEGFVEEQFTGDCVLREFDGVLYAAAVGRGDDLSIASVDFEAQLSGETGEVVVTIHRQDYDDDLGDWVLTGETDVYSFPFTLQNGHAVFSTMIPIY